MKTCRTVVHTLLFPMDRYTRSEANSWSRSHGYKATCKKTKTGRFWHCKQRRGRDVVGTQRFGRSGIQARLSRKC